MAPLFHSAGKTNYPYAVARVQAKRAKLIPPKEYEKILKMDVSEITRFIQDSVYRAEVDELSSRFEGLDLLEAALTVNQERVFAAVRHMLAGPGGRLVDLFMQRYLVEDLKALMRGKNAGASREELLKELLLEDLDTYSMFDRLLSEDVRTVQDVAQALLAQGGRAAEWGRVLAALPDNAGLNVAEDALDKAYYARLVEELESSRQRGSKEFLQFAKREIDARNLLNAARWVVARQDADFSPYVLPGGRQFRVAQVVELSRAPDLAAFADGLQDQGLPAGVLEGLDLARRQGRLAPFQAAVDRWLLGQLDKLGHTHPISILPILIFLIRKHREVVTLRAVARGKAAGLSEERLREVLP